MPVQGGDSFTLSSSEEQVITRAGDVSVSHFTGGTKYRLYGLVGGAWDKKLPYNEWNRKATEAVAADGTHQIDYLSAGADEDRFEAEPLTFMR